MDVIVINCLRKNYLSALFNILVIFLNLALATQVCAESLNTLNPTQGTLTGKKNSFFNGHLKLMTGVFSIRQGENQHINIDGLIGNNYVLDSTKESSVLFGLGCVFYSQKYTIFRLDYGINTFYFPKTRVKGNIIQENLFENLSYHYNVNNFPIYATGEVLFFSPNDNYVLALGLGLGPNFMTASNYREESLDDGTTIPADTFSRKTTTTLSATGSLGLRFNRILSSVAVEISYRYFYLGKGGLSSNSDQIDEELKNGISHSNALAIAFIF